MSSPCTMASTRRVTRAAGGVRVRSAAFTNAARVSCGSWSLCRAMPNSFARSKSSRALSRSRTNMSRPDRAVSTRCARTSCTVQPGINDGWCHWSACNPDRSAASCRLSACTVCQIAVAAVRMRTPPGQGWSLNWTTTTSEVNTSDSVQVAWHWRIDVFEFTGWGYGLDTVDAAQSLWAVAAPTLPREADMSPDTVVLAMRAHSRPVSGCAKDWRVAYLNGRSGRIVLS